MCNFIRIIALLTLLVSAHADANESRTKQDLSAVQKELIKSQKNYQEQNKKFTLLKNKLRDFELQVAQHAKALSLTEQGITDNKQQQIALKNENNQLNKQ